MHRNAARLARQAETPHRSSDIAAPAAHSERTSELSAIDRDATSLSATDSRRPLLKYAMASVDVKLTMDGVTRRVTLPATPGPTWAALSTLAASRFGLSGVRGLSYVDGDGDSIILSVHVVRIAR